MSKWINLIPKEGIKARLPPRKKLVCFCDKDGRMWLGWTNNLMFYIYDGILQFDSQRNPELIHCSIYHYMQDRFTHWIDIMDENNQIPELLEHAS